MPVPWIKIEVILPDKQEVVTMAHLLKMKDPDTVVGKLIRLWAWADQQTVSGDCVGITCAYIDRLTFCKGFAKALMSVGWLGGEDGALQFLNFARHNGETAKARAESARRMAKSRADKEQQNGNRNGAQDATDVTENGNGCAKNVALKAQRKAQTEGEIEFNRNKGGGGRIPPFREKVAPGGIAPPPPDVQEWEAREDPPDFDAFVRWVQSLRPGWDVGGLNARERQAALRAFGGLRRPVSDTEKTALKEYLSHEPERSSKFDYPPDRELFFTIFQEVVQKAMAWFRRTGRKTPAEKEFARKQAAERRWKEEERSVRQRAERFRSGPEELIEELTSLRHEHGVKPLTDKELEKIRQGDYTQ